MTWFGGLTHITASLAFIAAVLLLDRLLLHLGVIEHNRRRVSHRKLRSASAARGKLAAGTSARSTPPAASPDFLSGGSAGSVGVETPLSAPGCPSPLHPGADPELQAGDSRLDRDSAVATSSDESQPAPGSVRIPSRPGAGPQPRTATPSPRAYGEVAFPDDCGGSGQSSRSEPVPPDLAPVGAEPHPRGEGVGAACPRQVAPTMDAA